MTDIKNQSEMSPKKYTIREKINDMLVAAFKAKKQSEVMALRNIKTELTVKEKEHGQYADDSVAITLFKAMIKSRKKAIDIFVEQNREDLANENRTEIEIMSQFVPAQMEVNELKYALDAIAKDNNMYTKDKFGDVMKIFGQLHPGEDKGLASQLLKNILV